MKLFDLDGTLLDSNGLWREIDVQFLAKRGIPWTPEYNEGVRTLPWEGIGKDISHCLTTEDMARESGVGFKIAKVHGYIEADLGNGVMDYLDQCLQTGERMALFTSAEPSLCHAALSDRGFDRYLTDVVFAQHLGMEKRSPAAFREAARKLGVRPEEITFYDDSPVACRGAKGAGFTVIGVYDGCFAEYEAEMRSFCDGYIRSFRDLV